MQNKLSVLGVGYLGIGIYKSGDDNGVFKNYSCWRSMLVRVYSKEYSEKFPSYVGCSVAKEWHNFQNFAKWYKDNYVDGWDLDKDILSKGNKMYSQETCCFVPKEINYLFTSRKNKRGEFPLGVSKVRKRYRATSTQNSKQVFFGYFDTPEKAFYAYKKGKEEYIKILANKWKNSISPAVYQKMIDWKIEITD